MNFVKTDLIPMRFYASNTNAQADVESLNEKSRTCLRRSVAPKAAKHRRCRAPLTREPSQCGKKPDAGLIFLKAHRYDTPMKDLDTQQCEATAAEATRRAILPGRRRLLKLALAIICALLPVLSGCASLLDGKFVPRDGKETPFKPLHNPYEPPRDPTARE